MTAGLREGRLSVVVACHNYGPFLNEALNSLLAQTRPADEIVLVDDGSTDNTSEVIASFVASHPATAVISRHPNKGAVATFNDGIRQSSGELVVVLSADDRMSPSYLADLEAALATEHGFAYAQLRMFGARQDHFHARPFSARRLRLVNYIQGSALFRREVFDAVGGFDEAFADLGMEDWAFWLAAVREGYTGVGVNSCWLEYRRHISGSRNRIPLKRVFEVHRVLERKGLIGRADLLAGMALDTVAWTRIAWKERSARASGVQPTSGGVPRAEGEPT